MTGDDAVSAVPQDVPREIEGSTETPASPPPQDDLRSQLLARFEQWLDQMLAEESPPAGVPQHLLEEAAAGDQRAKETDLYTLFSSLVALTGEIRLQGRAFKQLSDLLAPLSGAPDLLAQLHEAQVQSVVSIQSALDDLSERSRDDQPSHVDFKDVCEVMIDLHDRLQRGLQTCDDGIASLRASSRKGGWLRRLGGSDTSEQAIASVQALRDAASLSLARLAAALQEWSVQRIGRAGDAFDPDQMSVVDVQVDSTTEPGTVLAVHRSGYAINGELKATAQVTVSKDQDSETRGFPDE